MPSIEIWLLDFDNTLAGLEAVVNWAESRHELERMLKAAGCPDDLFVQFPRGNLLLYNALLHRLRSEGFTPPIPARDLLERASYIIEKYEMAGVDRAQALPGAVELLRELLSRRVPAAVVTSNSSHTVVRWLALRGLAHTVRVVVGRDSLLPLKPAPVMVERALNLCNVDASRALLVGDSEADFAAAQATGIRFMGIAQDRERETRLRRAGAEAVFASPAELMRSALE